MDNVLLVDLGGVQFTFEHPHRLQVLGQCLAEYHQPSDLGGLLD